MGRFDLGFIQGQKARATAWHSFGKEVDREGLACSQSFSETEALGDMSEVPSEQEGSFL